MHFLISLQPSEALPARSPSATDLQGFLEQTYLFYGYYKVDKIHFPNFTYNLPLAYLLVTIAYLFLSLVWIVKRYLEQN